MVKNPKANPEMKPWTVTVLIVLLSPGFLLASLELIRMMFNLARYSS